MKNTKFNILSNMLKTALSVCAALFLCSCEYEDNDTTLNYKAGKIPGLGWTEGNPTGKPIKLPSGLELVGGIMGGGNSKGYWNQKANSTGTQSTYWRGSGSGDICLVMKLRNVKSSSVKWEIPAGSIFVSKSGGVQHGILLQYTSVTIPAASEATLILSLYCGNTGKAVARSGHGFDLGVESNAKPLLDLCDRLKNKRINIEKFAPGEGPAAYNERALQLKNILWKITDGDGLSDGDANYISSMPGN